MEDTEASWCELAESIRLCNDMDLKQGLDRPEA